MPCRVDGLSESLTILDVGHGNCALLQTHGEAVVIDAGPGSALLEALDERDIDTIHTLFVSHADHDHIGGIVALLASGRFTIRHVRLNSDAVKESGTWRTLVYLLGRARAGGLDFDVSLTSNGRDNLRFGDIKIDIVAPSPSLAAIGPGGHDDNNRSISPNSISAVIRVSNGERAVALLAGDIDDVGFDDAMNCHGLGNAQVLVFPHHGGNSGGDTSSFVQRLIEAVSPEFVIFSIGRGKFHTPRPEIVAAVKAARPGVRVACTELSEHCAFVTPHMDPPHLADVFARGRRRRMCCAGSIVLDLSPACRHLPLLAQHGEFIAANTTSPLCRRH